MTLYCWLHCGISGFIFMYTNRTVFNFFCIQVAPLDMFKEANTGTNLPAQIELYATPGDQYKFLFMAKGGGSANKSFLFQQTKALLNPEKLMAFVEEKVKVGHLIHLSNYIMYSL